MADDAEEKRFALKAKEIEMHLREIEDELNKVSDQVIYSLTERNLRITEDIRKLRQNQVSDQVIDSLTERNLRITEDIRKLRQNQDSGEGCLRIIEEIRKLQQNQVSQEVKDSLLKLNLRITEKIRKLQQNQVVIDSLTERNSRITEEIRKLQQNQFSDEDNDSLIERNSRITDEIRKLQQNQFSDEDIDILIEGNLRKIEEIRKLQQNQFSEDTVSDTSHSVVDYIMDGIGIFVNMLLSPAYYIWGHFNKQEHDSNTRTDVDSGPPPDGNMTTKRMTDAEQIRAVVEENNMEAFMSLEDTFVKAYPHDEWSWRLLHIVAVYGTAEMIVCMMGWKRIDWDRQHTIHEELCKLALKSLNVKEATALYLATCVDRTEIVRWLVKLAGEDNIRSCLQGLQLSNAMERVFMLELADRLRQKHACLKPTIVLGHQNENNGTQSRVFIVYSVSVVQTEDYDFSGLGLVKLRNPYVFKKTKTFSSVGETDLSPEDAQRVREAIQTHRDRLWLRHSNLNIITGRYVKTKRNGSDVDEACVLLYCSTKGVVPLGEEEFPRTICTRHGDRINVVVREGFFRLGGYLTESSTRRHSTLKMGCEIGRLTPQYDGSGNRISNSCGTLGPFVRYNNNLGFLSCSHVFFDMPTHSYAMNFTAGFSKVEVVQPSTDSTASVNNTACGFVERAVFAPNHSISIDAAVVTLTDPSRVPSAGHFSNDHHSSYKTAGFDELPEYNNAFMLGDINALKSKPTVIKFGSKTDVTRGALNVVGTDVRLFAKELGFGGSSDKVLMKNQYLVTGIYPSMDFFDGGDSGSAVFCQDDNGQLVCVGMAIGHCVLNDYPYKSGIVTPIDAILQALGPNITLATFP